MALSDHIRPSEEVHFSTDNTFTYGDDDYHVYITDDRLILYMERGLVRSKDDFTGWQLDNIERVDYEERGTIRKKGVVRAELSNGRAISLEGKAGDASTVNQQLMEFM